MEILFRTKLFDSSSPIEEGVFYGRDLAEWLTQRFSDWHCDVESEDWGWAIYASKKPYECIFGVYDHNINDCNANGPEWCIRLYNQKDWSNLFTKIFVRYIPPKAHPEVVDEVVQILRAEKDIHDLRVEPLD